MDKSYPKFQPEGIQGVAGTKEIPQLHEDAKNIQVFHEYLDAFLAEKAEACISPENNPLLPEKTIFLIVLAQTVNYKPD